MRSFKEMLSFLKRNKLVIAKTVLLILHLVGLLGLYFSISRPIFQTLTPVHLLVVTGILISFHKDFNLGFWLFGIFAFTVGMVSEIIGVKTGLIFGEYAYGQVLGFQVLGVPLIIGINWFLLVYLTGGILNKHIKNDILAAICSSILMVLMDVVLEPVAVKLDFWQWELNHIPLSNFAGWFLIAFIIQLTYRKTTFDKRNKLNLFIFINLILFFSILAIILE
ncbi:carotenoid biosynthesis protein [Cyclobacterium plantarum]|uniref:carotenoid biosynthesis protein n=1 Tax=Cyclobacterium plantarum TaxID=2716263 RepID=UPI003F72CD6A